MKDKGLFDTGGWLLGWEGKGYWRGMIGGWVFGGCWGGDVIGF